MISASHWLPEPTADGSFTFFSPEFSETFHSRQGARSEAFSKFVEATDLPQKAGTDRLTLVDVCYGLGYNTAAALTCIWQFNPNCFIEVIALELDPTVPIAALVPPFLNLWSPPVQAALQALALEHQVQDDRLQARLWLGDARQTLQTVIKTRFKPETSAEDRAQAIFLDPFSPRRCPQLWTIEFLGLVTHCLHPQGKLATYCRAAAVRSTLQQSGLCIGTLPLSLPRPVQSPSQCLSKVTHQWADGTVAGFDPQTLHPLSLAEQEHLQTRAAIPYRDPELCDSAAEILARRQAEQARSTLESTSSWRRRWGIV